MDKLGTITVTKLMSVEEIINQYDFTEAQQKALIKFRDMQLFGMYAENEKGERVNPITFVKE